jgi:hypothetical protein
VKQSSPRAAFCWVALAALLVNVLLPTALSVGIGLLGANRDTIGSSLCSGESGRDFPGKGKPALFVHHCALCTVAAALPHRRPPGVAYEIQVADAGYPRVQPVSTPTPFRHGRVQARAPPIAA